MPDHATSRSGGGLDVGLLDDRFDDLFMNRFVFSLLSFSLLCHLDVCCSNT